MYTRLVFNLYISNILNYTLMSKFQGNCNRNTKIFCTKTSNILPIQWVRLHYFMQNIENTHPLDKPRLWRVGVSSELHATTLLSQGFLVSSCDVFVTRWRHQVETVSALLAISAGYSPVTGEFPSQKLVTRSFDVFFVLRLNKRLSK